MARAGTAFIRELVELQWEKTTVKPEAGVEVLRLSSALPVKAYMESGLVLFSRTSTRTAWKTAFNVLENNRMSRVAMLGRPGIGKSRSLFYGLRELLTRAEPPVVIFEARKAGAVWRFAKDGSAEWTASYMLQPKWIAAGSPDLRNPNSYYLIDADDSFRWDNVHVFAKTVKACSPDRKHYSDFVKDGGTCVYVEDWTKEELEAAYDHLDGQPLLKEVLERFDVIGGNLRVLLGAARDYQPYVMQMRNDAQDNDLWESALMGVLETESEREKIRTRLFMYVSPNGWSCNITFASPTAMQVVMEFHYEAVLSRVGGLYNDFEGFQLEDLIAKFFLVGGLQRLQQRSDTIYLGGANYTVEKNVTKEGSEWNVKREQLNRAFAIPPEQTLRVFDDKGSFLKAWKVAMQKNNMEGQVWRAPPGFAAIDFVVAPTHVVSVTKGRRHSLKKSFVDLLPKLGMANLTGFNFTFLITQDPGQFVVTDDSVVANLSAMGATIQVVQVPATRDSIP